MHVSAASDIAELNRNLESSLTLSDIKVRNVAIAKIIHETQTKITSTGFPEKTKYMLFESTAKSKLDLPAFKTYYRMRSLYQSLARKKVTPRPHEIYYAIASNPLDDETIKSLNEIKDLFKDEKTLLEEIFITVLYSSIGDEEKLLSFLKQKVFEPGMASNLCTILEESFFGRNELNPLTFEGIIKVRIVLNLRLDFFLRMLSHDELFQAYAYIETLNHDQSKATLMTIFTEKMKKTKLK